MTAIKNAPLHVPIHPVLDKVWDRTKLKKVIKEYRFTASMGEKSEYLFGYVLEVLSRGPSQRVAMQDGLCSGKEEGGDVLVCIE